MPHFPTRRVWLQRASALCALNAAPRGLIALGAAAPLRSHAQASPDRDGLPDARWRSLEREARGQTVYFNAWAGSDRINAYLQWAAEQLAPRGLTLRHVKIAETAEAVQRLRAEQAAGRREGSIDLMWINGENFLRLRREGLLYGPFAEQLPSYRYVDTAGKPTTRVDFSEPVDGMEAPWGMAQLTFFADRRQVATLPGSARALLDWCAAHPGRFSYPKPPEFHGTTFLKQLLLELHPDRSAFAQPADAARVEALTAPLWALLDRLHPTLWRQGRQFPAGAAALRQMVADGELHIGFSFNPNDIAGEILEGRMPASVEAWQPAGGTLGNTHFLAIPVNARARAGAQVVADFLLSPAAQARKADPRVWGDPTVLDLARLPPEARAAFRAVEALPGAVARPAPAWPEPHASWVEPIEREWTRRYGA